MFFREIREIKKDETRKKKKEEEGYMQIKPESKMTYDEAKAFVESLFLAKD